MPLAEDVNLDELANITHGYTGADISSLAKESAMKTLRRILPQINLEENIIPPEVIENLCVTREDFFDALREIQPSALREVFVEKPNVKWADIGGLESVKQEIREAVELPLKKPEIFQKMGIRPIRGILLVGLPGTGKTLCAKAVATESEANFISIKGPEILSKWVGESEKAIREVFRKARSASPCIIFFDEFDSIVPLRGMRSGDSGVTERVISQFLTEIDGIQAAGDIVIIAATNRPDILDPAIIRPGRFDRLTFVPAPTFEERLMILKIFTKEMPLGADVNLNEIATKTDGFSGADLENYCREAAIRALRENIRADKVDMKHFLSVFDAIQASITDEMIQYYMKLKDQLLRRKTRRMMGEEKSLFT